MVALDERGCPDGWTFCGVTLADAGLPDRLPPGPSCVLRQGFVPLFGAVGADGTPASGALPVHAVPTEAFFADTGTPADLAAAHVRGHAWVAGLTPPA